MQRYRKKEITMKKRLSLLMVLILMLSVFSPIAFGSNKELVRTIVDNENIRIVESTMDSGLILRSTFRKKTGELNVDLVESHKKSPKNLFNFFSSYSRSNEVIKKSINLNMNELQNSRFSTRSGSFYSEESNKIPGAYSYNKFYLVTGSTYYRLSDGDRTIKTYDINASGTLKSYCTDYEVYVDNSADAIDNMVGVMVGMGVNADDLYEGVANIYSVIINMDLKSSNDIGKAILNILKGTYGIVFTLGDVVILETNMYNLRNTFDKIEDYNSTLSLPPQYDWPSELDYA